MEADDILLFITNACVAAPVFLVEIKADDILLLMTNACGCSCFLVEIKADNLLSHITNACGGRIFNLLFCLTI